MSVPPWTRDATRPTAEETERVTTPVDPELLAWARASTAPTDAERARIRSRPTSSTGAPWVLVWGMAALVALVVAGGWLAQPHTVSMIAAPVEAGVFVITPGIDVVPVDGVLVSGQGTVRLVPGALLAAGDLRLAITSPVTVEHDGVRFTARSAVVGLGPDGLVVLEGEVAAPDGVLPAGARWPAAVAARVASPAPETAPAPAPAPVHAPAPAAEVPEAPVAPSTPDPDARSEWRSVLEALEAAGPADERVARIEAYLAAWPGSPFRVEAEALRMLLRGPRATGFVEVERWLRSNPGAPRTLELEALAARIARDELHDCARARPHDLAVAAAGGATGTRARAFLGLCALSLGNAEEGRAFLDGIDAAELDPALRRAVLDARAAVAAKGG